MKNIHQDKEIRIRGIQQKDNAKENSLNKAQM